MKIKLILFGIFTALGIIFSCERNDIFEFSGGTHNKIPLALITLNKPNTTVLVRGTEQLTVYFNPIDATNKKIYWESDAPLIASVVNGNITGNADGTANITARSDDGNFTDTCAVTVSLTAVAVTGVSLSPSPITIAPGGSQILTVVFSPPNPTNQNVAWLSNNPAVATVSGGMVTAVGALGQSTNIIVTTADGGYTAACNIVIGL